MKSKLILVLAFLCIFISGCKAQTFVSQEKTIELMGNPSTGYTWSFEIADASIISVKENVNYLGKDGISGAPSLFLYTIRSLKAGNTTLKFEYKRSWETEPAEDVHFYEVNVKDNGKITLSEKK